MERSGSKTWQGQCVVFFVKALYSHSASLHSGVLMGIGKLLGKPDEILGGGGGGRSGDLVMDSHPIQGRVMILLVASYQASYQLG